MNLMDVILNAGKGAAVQQIGSQFGLGPDQTTSALSALVPALAAGLHQNATNDGGLANLMGALSSGGHEKYLSDPSTLGDAASIEDGKKILGHVLGSKDVSRQVASHAAEQTGVSVDVLKKMLPMAATLVMGALASGASQPAATGAAPGAGTDLLGLLSGAMAPSSQGPSVLGMLGKLFGR